MEYMLRKPIKAVQFTDVEKADELANFFKADRVDYNPMDGYIVLVFRKRVSETGIGNMGYQVNLYDYVVKMPSGRLVVIDEDTFNCDFMPDKQESDDESLTRFRNTRNPLEDTFNAFFEMARDENNKRNL